MASVSTSLLESQINCRPSRGHCVYFIGIGGIGMSAVARILIHEGCIVAGSDLRTSSLTSTLEEMGAKINTKQDGSFMSSETDMVVVSASISEDNLDLKTARKMGIKVVKYSQILGSLMKEKRGIAISGTHGKTTTSAMISTILKTAGLDPTFVIGGEVPDIGGNAHLGKGNLFVAEACEYDRSFLNLTPQVGVITNIEEDHLDYYGNIETIVHAFGDFASSISKEGLLVVNDNDNNIAAAVQKANCKVETYSLSNASDWYGEVLSGGSGLKRFRVLHNGKLFDEISLKIPGSHNVLNALAATAVCTFIGVDKDSIKNALSLFHGANRRFQIIGARNGITVIDDYAHHPTEIRVTLRAARELYPEKRIWCVFQPHQYSRTRHLLKEFSRSFQNANRVILADIYATRDNDYEKTAMNAMKLYEETRNTGMDIQYIPQLSDIVNVLYSGVRPGDIVMTMGAGDVWKVAYDLVSRF
ncbi:MAG: UDP-N-acetylmuramate--L-alanine ligase [Candidatus Brocadia sp.]|nr:UDP-N-acetylmuramate--L-alanine ligase [Candidatus Brocadia sp.]MCE7911664.1 UDP-N-acetylmuramate--L-alanine ligase [Candidatus Brocadia sp. AMX3]MDG5995775.1 UDP-N-acetylmuramate--L-alanine ligase [Candidatus Brocadia sp.]RIJ97741.1 MAG: UDP-N-acetylmuramate--L-alanine ligase [Candidatus Brocadia sp.]